MNNEMTSGNAMSFAAWELRLYLNTHPNDERAFAAYKQLCASQGCTYACNVIGANDDDTPECGSQTPTPTPYNSISGSSRMNSGCNRLGCNAHNSITAKMSRHPRGRVWHWIDDPWPWEPEANTKGGHC